MAPRNCLRHLGTIMPLVLANIGFKTTSSARPAWLQRLEQRARQCGRFCNLDLAGQDPDELVGYLQPRSVFLIFIGRRKEIFLRTPRHPAFKDGEIVRAHDLLIGSLNMLLRMRKLST